VNARLLFCSLLWVGCNKDDVDWTRFNSEMDVLEVHVTQSEEVVDIEGCALDTTCIDLHSRIEGAVIGTASVDPAAGPVGTLHKVLAVVGDDWEEQVGRVSLSIDGPRGVEDFELEQDRANPGAWGLTIESVGSRGKSGEDRVDVVTILLWEAEVDTESDDEA
jgi:hypothetical protein